MKLKEILTNFNLDNKEFRMLIKLKKIVKIGYNNFDVLDKQYVLDGNYEIFKQDYHKTPEYAQKIAKRNTKVNQSRWLKQSDEDRKKFGDMLCEQFNDMKYVTSKNSFKNWFVEEQVMHNRDPKHHKEIQQLVNEGLVKTCYDAGSLVYVYKRN